MNFFKKSKKFQQQLFCKIIATFYGCPVLLSDCTKNVFVDVYIIATSKYLRLRGLVCILQTSDGQFSADRHQTGDISLETIRQQSVKKLMIFQCETRQPQVFHKQELLYLYQVLLCTAVHTEQSIVYNLTGCEVNGKGQE